MVSANASDTSTTSLSGLGFSRICLTRITGPVPPSMGLRPDSRRGVAVRHDGRVAETGSEAVDPDLLIDFTDVSLHRDGHTLVGPVTWSVELDERWVIIGANGAGKTSLLRIAAAAEHPSSGVAYVLGERLGRVVARVRAVAVGRAEHQRHALPGG